MLKFAQVLLGLIDTPTVIGAVPDLFQMCLRGRREKGIGYSPATRGVSPLTTEESVEVERCRAAAAFAGLESLTKRAQLGFTVLEQSQRGRMTSLADR